MARGYDQHFGVESRAEYDPKTRTILLPTNSQFGPESNSLTDRLYEIFDIDTIEKFSHEITHSKYQNTMAMYKIFHNSIIGYMYNILIGNRFELELENGEINPDQFSEDFEANMIISMLVEAIKTDKESSYIITNSKNPTETIALIDDPPPEGLAGRLRKLKSKDWMALEQWQKEQMTTLEYYETLEEEVGEEDAKYITRKLAILSLTPPIYPEIKTEPKELPTGETVEFALDILVPRYRFRVSMRVAAMTIENDLFNISDYDEQFELLLEGKVLDLIQEFREYAHTENNYHNFMKMADIFSAPANDYPEFVINHLLDLPVEIPTDEFLESAERYQINENLPLDEEALSLYYITDLFELARKTTNNSLPAALVVFGEGNSSSYIQCGFFKDILSRRYEGLIPVSVFPIQITNNRQNYAWQWLYTVNYFRTEYFSTKTVPQYDENACTGCFNHGGDKTCHNLRIAKQFTSIDNYLSQEGVSVSHVLSNFPANPY